MDEEIEVRETKPLDIQKATSPSTSQSSEESSVNRNNLSSPTSSFEILKGAVGKSVNKVTSKNRIFPYFKECFKPLYRADSKNVVEKFKSMMDQLRTMINEEIDIQFDGNQVQHLLDELDSVKKGRTDKKAWRPSGNADDDLEAHIHEVNEKEYEHLVKMCNSLLAKNKLLNESVVRALKHVDATMHQLEAYKNNWDEAAAVIPEATKQDIVKLSVNMPFFIRKQ